MKSYIVPIVLVLGCVVLFGFNLGDLSLLKGDENYYFSSSRRMIIDGDWITPHYHHHIRFEKPILYYWVVALFFKLFGANWVAARLTSLLFGTLTVLIVYLLGLRFFTREKAIFSSTILATIFLFFSYTRLAVIDIMFLFFITLSLFLFVKGEREKKRSAYLFSFVSLGFSVMAKGPLGLAIFSLTVLTYIIITKKYRLLREMNLPLGVIILLLISLPWPIIMYQIHGQEYLHHIWKIEAVDKAVGSILNLHDIKNLPLFAIKYLGYYIPVVIFAFAPWGLLLPFSIFKKIKANKRADSVFILSWFWVVLLFFSVASFKHTHYMLLLSPPLAMIIANLFSSKKIFVAIAAITITFYLSLTGFLAPAVNDGALKSFALTLSPELKKNEEVGIASANFNLKKLGIYLNNLVSAPYELSGDDLAQYRRVKKGRLNNFLKSKSRVFCLITKRDFTNLVPKDLQERLYILEENLTWKRFNLKNAFPYILQRDFSSLKEEAYLISNRPTALGADRPRGR